MNKNTIGLPERRVWKFLQRTYLGGGNNRQYRPIIPPSAAQRFLPDAARKRASRSSMIENEKYGLRLTAALSMSLKEYSVERIRLSMCGPW
jgi:hypothetical protein